MLSTSRKGSIKQTISSFASETECAVLTSTIIQRNECLRIPEGMQVELVEGDVAHTSEPNC